jgi:predicted patatin/cPLA2 family phospholipase
MRSLVISSGGSKGSYAGGIIEKMIEDGKDWDIYVGSSTGSLMVPFVAAGDMDGLKKCYLDIDSSKIYTHDPFTIVSNNNGHFKFKINHWSIIRNFLSGNRISLGNTEKLRDLIEKNFTLDHYNKIIGQGKDCRICVTNLTLNKIEVKSINDYDYLDFCDWIWASTCAPPFMSIVDKDGYEYVDSGVLRSIPIREAVITGSDEIDVIVLNPKDKEAPIEKVRNALHFIQLVGRSMFYKNQSEDLDLFKLIKDVTIESPINMYIYYTHRELTNNALLFDKELMNKWWNEGYMNPLKEKWRLTKSSVRLV